MARSFTLDPGDSPSTPTPRLVTNILVSWSIGGNLKDVVGFNVALTTTTGSPLNAQSVRYAASVQNPLVTSHKFYSVPAGDYLGWVQAVARGGDSKWMSTTALSVVDDGKPTVRGSDDRNVAAFCEDFRSASLPTGISVFNASYSLVSNPGSIVLTPTGSAGNFAILAWDVEAWIDAYLDSSAKRDGIATVIVRVKYEAAIGSSTGFTLYLKKSDGSPFYSQFNFPLARIKDASFHDYRYQTDATITLTGANSAEVQIVTDVDSTNAGGGKIHIDAIALGFDNFDQALDGNVDKGIQARDQFDKDPTGGGFFLVSPVRPAGSGSSQLVMDENGIFWLRDESGNLVTEHGYKLGRAGATTGAAGGTEVAWTDSSYISPAIPVPSALNKVRLAFERRGAWAWQSTVKDTLRVYLEATHLQTSGFRIQHFAIEANSPALSRLQKDMTAIAAAKGHDEMTLNASDTFTTAADNANDAFWENKNDAAEPFTSSFYSFRQVAWISVVMPESKKADGSYYYCDLKFIVKYGDVVSSSLGGGLYSYTLGTEYQTLAAVVFRCYADGRTWLIPIPIGKINPPFLGGTAAINYNRQGIAVRYRLRTLESGAPAGAYPTTVSMPRCDVDYYTHESLSPILLGQQNLSYIHLEEF